MKLLLFNEFRLGILKPNGYVVDVTSAVPGAEAMPRTPLGGQALMEALIDGFDKLRPRLEAMSTQEEGIRFESVKVRPPLPRPPNALCAFSNYQDRDRPKPPVEALDFFLKSASCFIGFGDTVELPDWDDVKVFQPEPEFAVVIARQARKLTEAKALESVFGYMNFCDVSARGIPNRRTHFFGKCQEGFAPIGPVIVTKDEIPDPQKVRVRLWLNGELRQDYSTSDMSRSVAAQISWASKWITLQPGDVIAGGTHHLGLSPINDGDTVEIEGEGLERLRFGIRSSGPRKTSPWAPPGVASGHDGRDSFS